MATKKTETNGDLRGRKEKANRDGSKLAPSTENTKREKNFLHLPSGELEINRTNIFPPPINKGKKTF